tara:strand:- start:208 stop:483 length:276 start_codon:yes stop_codon:yes gene_type:complete
LVWFFLFLFVWLPCGFFAGAVAEEKGHNGIAWFFGGSVFGFIGLVSAAGLSDRKLRRYQRFQAEAQGYVEKEPVDARDAARQLINERNTGV